MSKKITPTQFKVVSRMKSCKWLSAYQLKCSMATLNSLATKGIVEKNTPLGSMFCPQTNIQYRLLSKYKDIKLGESYVVGV